MNFSKELIEKAKTASSAEELLEMAKADGVKLSAEDAEIYFRFLTTGCQPLSDEDLEQVAGGKGALYSVGQKVKVTYNGETIYGVVTEVYYSEYQDGYYYKCLFDNGWEINAALEEASCGVKVIY